MFGWRKRDKVRSGRDDAAADLPTDPAALLATAEQLRLGVAGNADPGLLAEALAVTDRAVAAHPAGNARALALSIRCVLQRTAAARGGGPAALGEAVAAGREARGLVVDDPDLRSRCAAALATSLLDVHQRQRDIRAVDEAVVLTRQTVDELDPEHPEYVGMLSNLANALLLAAQAHQDADLLNESITASRSALRELDARDPRWVTVSVNLASALMQQAIMTKSVAPVQEARTHVHGALQRMPPNNPNRPAVQGLANRIDLVTGMLKL